MRRSIAIAALAGSALGLAGCGEGDTPSLPEVEDELELRMIRLPDGRQIECLYYAENGAYTSWLAFDCNWDNPPLNG